MYSLKADGHHSQDVKRVLEVPAFYQKQQQQRQCQSVQILTTSRDKTAKTWFPNRTTSDDSQNDALIEGLSFEGVHRESVASAAFVTLRAGYKFTVEDPHITEQPSMTVLVTASNDKQLVVWDLDTSAMEGVLLGHTDVVYSIASLSARQLDGGYSDGYDDGIFVTGSWDYTCIVWDLNGLFSGQGALKLKFKQHTKAVMCVAPLFSDAAFQPLSGAASVRANVLSGGADGVVLLWDPNDATVLRTFKHGQTVQAIVPLTGRGNTTAANSYQSLQNHFIAADNSGSIRQWDAVTGALIAHIREAHDGFVYGLAYNHLKHEIISCGEDRMVKVWTASSGSEAAVDNDNDREMTTKLKNPAYRCAQVIPHPQLVWSVCAVASTSTVSGHADLDIATACYDGFVRIFTRNPAERCSAEKLQLFQDVVSTSELNASTGDGSLPNKENLPTVETIHTIEGTHEGQKLLARAPNGDVEAFVWSVGGNTWEKIGTVVETHKSSSRPPKKQHTDGNFYDYLLPIQLPGVSTTVMLPYNRGQSVYDAAQEFINQYAGVGVSQMDREPIQNHILSQISNEDAALIGAGIGGAMVAGNVGSDDTHASEFAREAAALASQGGAAAADHRSWQDDFRRLQEEGGEEVAFSQYAKEAAEARAAGSRREGAVSATGTSTSMSNQHLDPVPTSAPSHLTANALVEHIARQYYDFSLKHSPITDPITAWSGAGCAKKLAEFGCDPDRAAAVTDHPLKQPQRAMELIASVLIGEEALLSQPPGKQFPALDLLRFLLSAPAEISGAASVPQLSQILCPALVSPGEIDRRVAFRCLHNLFATWAASTLCHAVLVRDGEDDRHPLMSSLRIALTATNHGSGSGGDTVNYVKVNHEKTIDDFLHTVVKYLIQCRLSAMSGAEDEGALMEAHSELTTLVLDAIGAVIAIEAQQERQTKMLKLAIALVYYRLSDEDESNEMNKAVCLSHLQGDDGEGHKIMRTLKVIQKLYNRSYDGVPEHTLPLEVQTERNYFEKHVKHNTSHVYYTASALLAALEVVAS